MTRKPSGVLAALALAADDVRDAGKVAVFAVVSIWTDGEGGAIAVESGKELVRAGVEAWARQMA